jgi:hypothetical protein
MTMLRPKPWEATENCSKHFGGSLPLPKKPRILEFPLDKVVTRFARHSTTLAS